MRILVVEDEKNLADSLKRALETEGFAVDIAPTGDLAYEVIFGEEYDLILLDIGLPGMDGLELITELRKENISTPVLMLTARDTTADKVQGLSLGADDYLVKPFEFEELLVRIKVLLRRPKDILSTEIVIDNLVLNLQTKNVKRDNISINLTAKEYALLEYLMRNKGVLLTKQLIMDHVWDSELDDLSNTVDVYIGYLRSKIDKAFPKDKALLKTIKGMGYKLG